MFSEVVLVRLGTKQVACMPIEFSAVDVCVAEAHAEHYDIVDNTI